MVYKYFTTNLQIILNFHTMSMYIFCVNVIYSLFTDKTHTIYILLKKENLSSDNNIVILFAIVSNQNFSNATPAS